MVGLRAYAEQNSDDSLFVIKSAFPYPDRYSGHTFVHAITVAGAALDLHQLPSRQNRL